VSPRILTATLLAIALSPRTAAAWEPLFVCWPNDIQTWDSSTLDIAIADPSFFLAEEAVIDAGADEWDSPSVGGTSLTVTSHVDTTTQFLDINDGVNLIARSPHPIVSSPGVLGWADIRGEKCLFSTTELVEVDIHLTTNRTWGTASEYYDFCDDWGNAGNAALEDTVRHEIGHGLGLAHVGMGNAVVPGTHLATMYQLHHGPMNTGEDEYIGVRPQVVSEDDRVAMRSLYTGSSTLPIDLAVQSQQYDVVALDPFECTVPSRPSPIGSDLTQLALDAGLPLGSCPMDANANCLATSVPPDANRVVPGTELDFTFTFLNLGITTESPNVRLILTTEHDPTPTTFTVLDAWTPTITPNLPFEEKRENVAIPDVPTGTYYVIAQIDYDGQVGEADETNNEAFFNQQIVVESSPCGCSSGGAAGGWGLLAMVGVLARRRRHDP
jgi:MYXO-CTERM domain-containing protein